MAEYREFHCPYGDEFEGGDECDRCEHYELCMETPTVDVVERAEYKKVLQDCRKIHDENNELIAGFSSLDAKYAKLNEGINKAIEEINDMAYIGFCAEPLGNKVLVFKDDVLEILKRNIGE